MTVGIKQDKRVHIDNINTTQKKGTVTIAGKPSDEIDTGTENSIIKQAGLK